MDFLSIQLSIRDREQLSNILCSLQPDLLTQAIRDSVAAYDPIIRECHNAVDLSGTLLDFENFLTDFIKLSKSASAGADPAASRPSTPNPTSNSRLVPSRPVTPTGIKPRKSGEEARKSLPTVEDYIKLLRKHQSASHRFLHQVVKKDKGLAQKWVVYAKHACSQFQRTDPATSDGGAGAMTSSLQDIFSKVPEGLKQKILDKLDDYSAYTSAHESLSRDRWNSALSEDGHTSSGPGMYLAKWQYLLDTTAITPATAHGPVRCGKDRSVREKAGVGVETMNREAMRGVLETSSKDGPAVPDVALVIDALGPGFVEIIKKQGKEVWDK